MLFDILNRYVVSGFVVNHPHLAEFVEINGSPFCNIISSFGTVLGPGNADSLSQSIKKNFLLRRCLRTRSVFPIYLKEHRMPVFYERSIVDSIA